MLMLIYLRGLVSYKGKDLAHFNPTVFPNAWN